MSLQINDLVVESTLSASTLTASTLYVGTNNIGGTTSNFNTLSATTFSAGTIYSGSTDLYSIFLTTNDGNDITRVQPGTNTYTGGTANNPTINVSALTINTIVASGSSQLAGVTATSISGSTVSGGTLFSGSTNLYNIFIQSNQVVNNVNAGSNITTGGTATSPIVNVVASPSFNSITFSGTAIGGGLQVGAGTLTSLSATTLSGGTIFSGSTNLYSVFQPAGANTVVGNGTNTYTGGTFYNQTVNVSALTINTLVASGSSQLATVTATSISGGTLSGGTLFSGSTNLYQIFTKTGSTLIHKSGSVSGSTFAGNPKKSTVTFATAFADTNYAITISSDTNRTWTWESKTASGFVINANANTAFNAGNVNWTATEYGEK